MDSDNPTDSSDALPQVDLGDPQVGVPQRFGVGSLLVVTAFFALLLGTMSAAGWPPPLLGSVAVFFVVIGVSQATLFKGQDPRRASILTGIGLGILVPWGCALGKLCFGAPWNSSVVWVLAGLCFASLVGVPLGGVAGYFAGAILAGVFLVMQRIESLRDQPIRGPAWPLLIRGVALGSAIFLFAFSLAAPVDVQDSASSEEQISLGLYYLMPIYSVNSYADLPVGLFLSFAYMLIPLSWQVASRGTRNAAITAFGMALGSSLAPLSLLGMQGLRLTTPGGEILATGTLCWLAASLVMSLAWGCSLMDRGQRVPTSEVRD